MIDNQKRSRWRDGEGYCVLADTGYPTHGWGGTGEALIKLQKALSREFCTNQGQEARQKQRRKTWLLAWELSWVVSLLK
jgi:hypothetical protein